VLELVLFDLSGVLVDFRGAQALGELIGLAEEQVWPRWLTSPWMRRFDAGACSEAEFAAGVVEEWGLQITPFDFLESFRSWMVGPYPGAEALVRRTADGIPTGCLSNMNPLHWRELARWDLTSAFDHRFISCELGLVKPDREIYEHVTAAVGSNPECMLFLDDNQLNVQAAVDSGLQAAHVLGVSGAERALAAHGLL
jgi:putative hydrolase of the HAD superfamily